MENGSQFDIEHALSVLERRDPGFYCPIKRTEKKVTIHPNLVEAAGHGDDVGRRLDFVLLGPSARAQLFRLDTLEDGRVQQRQLRRQTLGAHLQNRRLILN